LKDSKKGKKGNKRPSVLQQDSSGSDEPKNDNQTPRSDTENGNPKVDNDPPKSETVSPRVQKSDSSSSLQLHSISGKELNANSGSQSRTRSRSHSSGSPARSLDFESSHSEPNISVGDLSASTEAKEPKTDKQMSPQGEDSDGWETKTSEVAPSKVEPTQSIQKAPDEVKTVVSSNIFDLKNSSSSNSDWGTKSSDFQPINHIESDKQ